jgi:histidinol-phosphate/aromatic aminotransferase/cobyric acid decarboxylase-like protein
MLGVAPEEVLDLSMSLNPVAPDPSPVIAKHLDALGRYPDARRATNALAQAMGIDPARLVLTNGGAEAIALVASELGRGWVEEPEFSLYRRYLAVIDPAAARWRSNPHNPTGMLAAADDRAGVWDEAFWPLATGTWTRGDAEIGAVVVGSLTKLFACPGLRAGYVLCADAELPRRLSDRQPLWSLNGLAAAALPEMLESADLARWAWEIAALRRRLVEVVQRAGYQVRPSQANWVLVESSELREHLARRGIAVRDCASFGLPGVVRIAVPNEAGLARLEASL